MGLTGQDGEDDIAGGETGLQSLGTSSLDGSQPMAGHRPQDLDELTVAIGVLGELARTWARPDGKSQSLKGAPLRSAPGFFSRTGR